MTSGSGPPVTQEDQCAGSQAGHFRRRQSVYRLVRNYSTAHWPSALLSHWKLMALGIFLGCAAWLFSPLPWPAGWGTQLLLSLPAVWILAGLVVTVAAWDRWLRQSPKRPDLFALRRSEPASKPGRRTRRRPSSTPEPTPQPSRARPQPAPPRCPDCGTPCLLVDSDPALETDGAGPRESLSWTCPSCGASVHRWEPGPSPA